MTKYTLIGLLVVCLAILSASTIIGYAYTNDNGYVNYDWKLETTDHIGQYFTPSPGYEFVVATVYLQNYSNGVDVAPTPDSWILVANNVTYSPDYVRSYDDSLGYTNIPIPYGSDATTKVVYDVPINATSGYIKHNGPFNGIYI